MNSSRNKKNNPKKLGEEELNPEDFKEMKKRGAIGNLYLKGLGNLGLVENTTLNKGFVESIGQHEEYRRNIDQMFNAVELILQPNPQILAEGKLNEDAVKKLDGSKPFRHPLQKISGHIQKIQKFMTPLPGKPDFMNKQEKFILSTLSNKCDEMAEMEKKSRTDTRSLMNRTRLFLTKEYEQFKENRQEVDRYLLIMDDMRNQVKKAKTKAELEKAGKGYIAAVYEFNRRAELIDRVLESHPESVYFHQRDLNRAGLLLFLQSHIKMFTERSRFHHDMAKKVQEWDNKGTVLEEPVQPTHEPPK